MFVRVSLRAKLHHIISSGKTFGNILSITTIESSVLWKLQHKIGPILSSCTFPQQGIDFSSSEKNSCNNNSNNSEESNQTAISLHKQRFRQ